MKKKVLLIILVAIFSTISAQSSKELFIKLIDSETSQPISYATVVLKGTSLGVIADYNGELRMPTMYYDNNNTIVISSIGYQTKEVPLKSLDLYKTNVLKIATQIEALDTVVVTSRSKTRKKSFKANELVKASRRMSAKEIVRKAIAKIPENLSSTPHSYVGYYRDYQLVDNKFHNLNEAIFETFDPGINTNFLKENKAHTAVYSFKQNTNFIQDTSLTKAYNGITKYIQNAQILPRGGNEYTILKIHNPIRNYSINTFSYVYTLESDFPKLHDFSKDEVVFFNNEPLLLINFRNARQHDTSVYGLRTGANKYVEGSIYISLIDYSIHRFNYKVFFPGTKNVLFNVNIEYARKGEHMYLNYITFNNSFVVAEDFILKEEKVIFDNKEQAFYITFNNTKDYLNSKTLIKDNFKFKLGKRSLKTVGIEKESERQIKVFIKSFEREPINITKKNVEDLSFTFRRIEDVKGRVIYQSKSLKGDQFREFFVQQINLNQSKPSDLTFMDQNSPINEVILNRSPDAGQYWINSPLMDKKYRDEDGK